MHKDTFAWRITLAGRHFCTCFKLLLTYFIYCGSIFDINFYYYCYFRPSVSSLISIFFIFIIFFFYNFFLIYCFYFDCHYYPQLLPLVGKVFIYSIFFLLITSCKKFTSRTKYWFFDKLSYFMKTILAQNIEKRIDATKF